MILAPNSLAEFAGLAVLAGVGHVASLVVGDIDKRGRRDRPFGVMVLFILLCSPVFFDNRPHDLGMMAFAFSAYLIAISIMERNVAATPLIKKLLSVALVVSILMTLLTFEYLVTHFPTVARPGAYALSLFSRNIALFLLVTRGAYYAYVNKHLSGYLICYVLLILVSPFLTDFALIICGPLIGIGCWALGGDLRRLRQKMTL